MSEFGSLVLLIGDYHTPQRKGDIPGCFKELLQTDKIATVFCTGNVGSKSVVEDLTRTAGNECYFVAGDGDYSFDFPETVVANVGDFKVGMIHGHQIIPWGDKLALAGWACRLGVDMLISGHTHRHSVEEYGGKFLINPGSVTGASSALGGHDHHPSFMLMQVQGSAVTLYTYEEENGETKVTMNELKKA
mmetsp:Transcript_54341/g.129488  ORF Transcript_54341/g.129488 Transcript_54341/m.129488 type:complete len:190 (-) Transcript_54341:66-635(-)|eukprot:CAMPEP_0178407146 /NCGR_PEP_ID=MMETSP0689_2-20121128/19277_1 /TAXON_ID=160604 /ORGANISM="Amphidinium massartii, Strain CS-259" /LENGTH=189 /DNA_ID=CAMNT_0020028209 /DNA_START=49 /DNA_END=618 /DNA_ORIENTATION=+